MESHEVLKRAMKKTSPKAIASDLGVSLSLVYKWAEKPAEGSGSKNPLDRLLRILELSEDPGILEWLCRKRGGHFVANPGCGGHDIRHILPATQEIISQFSDLLSQISNAAVDHKICDAESKEIRECWDKLKSYTEGFVRCCENGDFDRMLHIPPPSEGPERLEVR